MKEEKDEIRLTVTVSEKTDILCAAKLNGMTLAGFVRYAAIRMARGQ